MKQPWQQFQQHQQQMQQQRQRLAQGAAWLEQQKREQQKAAHTMAAARPEVDERFQRVEIEAAKLRDLFAAGKLSEQALVKNLSQLMVQDTAGTWWMVGTESGHWYRYNGADWVPGIPPGHEAAGIGPAAQVKAISTGIGSKINAFFTLIAGIFVSFTWYFVAHGVSYDFLRTNDSGMADLGSFAIGVVVGLIPLVVVIRYLRKQA